jgi:hypothetical protein
MKRPSCGAAETTHWYVKRPRAERMTFLSEESVASGCEKFGIECKCRYRRREFLADPQIDKNMTRATVDLPGLEIEIIHLRPSDNVEQISIKLQAVPSFDASEQFLETANPFAFWFRAAEIAWLPWSGLAQMMRLPLTVASTPPQLSSSSSNNNPSG